MISVREAKALPKNKSGEWKNKYICVEGTPIQHHHHHALLSYSHNEPVIILIIIIMIILWLCVLEPFERNNVARAVHEQMKFNAIKSKFAAVNLVLFAHAAITNHCISFCPLCRFDLTFHSIDASVALLPPCLHSRAGSWRRARTWTPCSRSGPPSTRSPPGNEITFLFKKKEKKKDFKATSSCRSDIHTFTGTLWTYSTWRRLTAVQSIMVPS